MTSLAAEGLKGIARGSFDLSVEDPIADYLNPDPREDPKSGSLKGVPLKYPSNS